MNAFGAITYVVAVTFWLLTAGYALLASRDFIVEQFLKPGLFAPLTVFAQFWPVSALVILVLWVSARRLLLRHRELMFTAPLTLWIITAVAAMVPGVAATVVGPVALGVAMAATAMLWLLATAEHPVPQGAVNVSNGRTAADFFACGLAAIGMVLIEALIQVVRVRGMAGLDQVLIGAARTQLLGAMIAFLILTMVRAFGAMLSRQVTAEARFAIVALGALFGWFLYRVALASISLDGMVVGVAAYLGGYAIAVAITAPAVVRFSDRADGVRSVAGAFAPTLTGRWSGFLLWAGIVAGLAVAFDSASRLSDWNFVLARTGVVAVWLCILGGALRVVQTPASGHAGVFLGFAVIVLGAHAALDRTVGSVIDTGPTTPATRWAADLLRPEADGPAELYELLPKHTNTAGPGIGAPVDVNWATLSGAPSAHRPDIFLFVVDSLRRDYLSPYNDRVTFTPAIAAFARDSLVFERAFTQYGATGLSVPSIWSGGPMLHKHYVTPFAPMNALAKLLAHEQYAQWLSVDHIVEVIVPKTAALEPLDRNRPVKNFRLCATLDELRARLAARAAGAPVFAYTLPQDVQISAITREGSRSIDAQTYDGFDAPVASRVRRFDACFGAFVDDLKSRGRYDNSIVVLTSDHGDSLGEDGRIGHTYTLYPEIARVPLIVHVPPALRESYTWDTARPAYTTDLTPTLFQLLGHPPASPGPVYGDSLARLPGSPPHPQRDRMIASSYGAVYGAVLRGGTAIYVADAIERREWQFAIGAGAEPGRRVEVDAAVRREGMDVIKSTVEALARAYQLPAR